MAKIVIELEDATGPDGEVGMSIDFTSDPPMDGSAEMTPAQTWAAVIIEMIADSSKKIIMLDPETDEVTEVIENDDKGDTNGTDGNLH